MAGAAAGTLAANRTNAATRWQAHTYNTVGTVSSVVGFKRLIDNFEKASNGTCRRPCGASDAVCRRRASPVTDAVIWDRTAVVHH